MHAVEAESLGWTWLAVCRKVLAEGETGRDGREPLRELLHLTVRVRSPRAEDAVLARLADPQALAWMRANFCEQKRVRELGDAPSYATRLRNHLGRDQVAWVIDRLRHKPESKAATLTTLLPDDASYVPCVSLLDFKLRGGVLLLTASCRSIDVGVKLPGNLAELARLQEDVAGALGHPVGSLTLWVVSAHIYERDVPGLEDLLSRSGPQPSSE
jgi:thymidylate synthase